MLSFLTISDKFANSISWAARGECHEDMDTYEILNFQLDQWRRKYIGEQSIGHLRQKLQDPSMQRPLSWAILLTLRAEAVRTLLLRPFFFPKASEKVSTENIGRALELVSDLVNIVYALDQNTNLYCLQGPFYHYALTSATALFFLIVTCVQSKILPSGASISMYLDSFASIYQQAFDLSTKYYVSSQASRRLVARLMDLRGTLVRLGVSISSVNKNAAWIEANGVSLDNNSAITGTGSGADHTGRGDRNSFESESNTRFHELENQKFLWPRWDDLCLMSSEMAPGMDMGVADAILLDWPMHDQGSSSCLPGI